MKTESRSDGWLQRRRRNNRQSLPWGFLFFRSPQRCVWADRSRFLDPTGQGVCQMKKRIHCTSAPCASIMRCTSGMQVAHPLKQWSCRRWAWMDRAAEKPEDPLPIAFSLWSTLCRSYNSGTQRIPHHSRTQRQLVLQLFPPHLLVGTQTWQVKGPLTGGTTFRS